MIRAEGPKAGMLGGKFANGFCEDFFWTFRVYIYIHINIHVSAPVHVFG